MPDIQQLEIIPPEQSGIRLSSLEPIYRLIHIDRQSVFVERDSTPGTMYKLGDGAEMTRENTLKYLHLLRCQVIDELDGE